MTAMTHPTAVKDYHVTDAMKHPDESVGNEALKHPTAVNAGHIADGLNHPDPMIRYTAKQRKEEFSRRARRGSMKSQPL